MQLYDLKTTLTDLETISFKLPNDTLVPSHFHVTEVGLIKKQFIDCGGTFREELKISLQLWEADDYDHRLHPEKLLDILSLSEEKLDLPDAEIEVEYQGETIQKYGLSLSNGQFHLKALYTNCLAEDACGISPQKDKIKLVDFGAELPDSNDVSTCTPGGGCC